MINDRFVIPACRGRPEFLKIVMTSQTSRDPNATLALASLATVVASSRHARWMKFGGVDRQEEAILGMSAEIGQISNTPGLVGVANLFL